MSRIRSNVASMHAYTPGEQPTGASVIKLNTNENPYPPSPAVLEVLEQFSGDWLRLYPDPQAQRLRETIARHHGCTVEHVCCGNGSDELLALAIRAFVPNDGVIGYFDPSYSLYPVLGRIADVKSAPLPLREDFTCDTIPENYDVPLFFWTNPNAPTSLRCEAECIKEFAIRSEGVVLIDEAYADFSDENCMQLALDLPNVLVTRSFSKSYSLAGLRLGYVVGNPELVSAFSKIKDAYNLNRLTQEAGCAAIVDQAYLQLCVQRVLSTRSRISQALRERGFDVADSQTNFLWIKPSSSSARDLFAKLRSKEIYVRYFDATTTKNHLRVTVGKDADMDEFIRAIDS